MFTTDIQPRFTDYDMFGHVNNTVLLQYLDLGKALFFNSIIDDANNPAKIGSVIVNVNINFSAPALVNEPLQVSTAVSRLGNRSFVLHQRVYNADSGVTKADAHTTMAGFDIHTQSGADIPTALRTALQAHIEPDTDGQQ